ncbi:MAG: hypothetical protein JWM58_3161 [Rhizobium sp.]|nr:hypothetical protein [Rhizobium sp.]
MRHNIFGAAALAVAVLVSGSAFAADHGPSLQEREKAQNAFRHEVSFGYQGANSTYSRPDSFTIVRLGEISRGAAGTIKAAATRDALEALRASINSNPDLASELRQHGVQIQNIIGSATAFNGRTVFYLK